MSLLPEPCRSPLELDGQEVGLPLLASIEPLRSYPPGAEPWRPIAVPQQGSVAWEAEAGLVLPGMQILADKEASAGRYVCEPPGSVKRSNGSVLWSLQVPKPGRYYLWARVRAFDPQSDSFYFQAFADNRPITDRLTWALSTTSRWQWQRMEKGSESLDLPAGLVRLQLRTREAGAQVDRLLLTSDQNERISQ